MCPSPNASGPTGEQLEEFRSLVAALAEYDALDPDIRAETGIPTDVIRRMIEALGIAYPVRFHHAPVYDVEQPDDIYKVVEPNKCWLFEKHECGKRGGKQLRRGKCRVDRYEEGGRTKWTCSCPWWIAHKGRDCRHIKKVKLDLGLLDDGAYVEARRRPLPRWLYAKGELCESTRRKHARDEWYTRGPKLFEELVNRHVTEPSRVGANGKPKRGPIGITRRLATYMLLVKVFEKAGYQKLGKDSLLKDVEAMWRLGWTKAKAPGITKMCEKAALPGLESSWRKMTFSTARFGRLFETGVGIDSDQTPTVPVVNSRDRKAGSKPPSYRATGREQVVTHAMTGDVTGLIADQHVTLDRGLGSHDGAHYVALLESTVQEVFPGAKTSSGDGAYGAKRNYLASERLNVDLYTRELQNEEREDPKNNWPPSAVRLRKMERTEPAKFKNVYRFRSKTELRPSRAKRHEPFMHLRRRKTDVPVPYPPHILKHFSQEEAENSLSTHKSKRLAAGKRLCDLPEADIATILDVASKNVGLGQLNEAWAKSVMLNVLTDITLEHLCGDKEKGPFRVDYVQDIPAPYIPIVEEDDLRKQLAQRLSGKPVSRKKGA